MQAKGYPPDHWAMAILRWIVSVFLFLMMAITFADVLGRYVVHAPIFGAAEMIQFLLAGTVFAGLILVSKHNSHIAVDLFAPAIRARMPFLHDLIVVVFSVSGLLVIGYELAHVGLNALETGRRSIVLEWPFAMVALPSAFFCVVAALVQTAWLFGSRR